MTEAFGARPATHDRRPTWTLVCGVLVVSCCAPLAVAAVFLGLQLRRELGAAAPLSAKVGYVLGWIGVVIWALSLVGFTLSAVL
jgi:hypothetical protein